MTSTQNNQDRLNMRLGKDLKAQVQYAAKLKGIPVAGYAKSVLAAAVAKDIADQEFLVLSLKDREAFAQAIIKPIQPSQEAIEAALEYKERFGL
ncbi:MAG: DUF1778 domain-containing protein [Candidatus Obscuribacterales bacterium]|jgi:uncharacterized protein (DUF1778 family)